MGLRVSIERSLLAVFMRMPTPMLEKVCKALEEHDRSGLSPQIRFILAAADKQTPFQDLPILKARALYRSMFERLDVGHEPVAHFEKKTLTVHGGEIQLRIYKPFERGEFPAVMYMHGGGHVLGTASCYDQVSRFLSKKLNAVLVSVDYRKAPEYRFPTAAEDCLAAWEWLVNNAEALGADPARIGVMGDSAGGNLAAVVSQQAAKRGLMQPTAQCLVYPELDMRQQTESYKTFGEGYGLDRDLMNWFVDQYLGEGRPEVENVMASPGLAEDVSGQPPAVITTTNDPLRDEALAYAEKLKAAGVPVVELDFPTLVHGHIGVAGAVPAAYDALFDICEAYIQIL
jgi:acetyl esterase